MNIQVIIPVYRPDDKLIKLIRALKKQTVKPTGITLVVSTTGKGTEPRISEAVAIAPEIRILEVKASEFDHGGTRRWAVERTECDVFVMMTQDAVPNDEFLIERLTGAIEGNTACAYARQLAGSESSTFEKISRLHNYPGASVTKTKEDIEKLGIKAFFCSDVCCAYDREKYINAGGFIRKTIFNEDMIIARKFLDLGYLVRYEADAAVIHSHDYSAMEQLKRNFDLGVSQAQNPDVFAGVSSESEGMKLVKSATKILLKKGKWYMIPGFYAQCGFKLTGYKLGKNYAKLPEWVIMCLTSNKSYWKK